MWRTRFDQRGVRLPPAARQLLRGGMLVGLLNVCMCVCVCVCSHPHRAPPHFTDMPGTVRRPTQCPTERNYLQHYTIQLIKLSDEVVFVSVWLLVENGICSCEISTSVLLCFNVLDGNISQHIHSAGRQKRKKDPFPSCVTYFQY